MQGTYTAPVAYPWSILRVKHPYRFSTLEEEPILLVRILVTVEPRMYREAIALALQRNRPDAEVMLAPEVILNGQVKDFAPHVLVRNASGREPPEEPLADVEFRLEVIYTDHMAARVTAGGRSYTIEDASMDDLLSLVDEASKLAGRDEGPTT